MKLLIGQKWFNVSNVKEASEIYSTIRDKSGRGASNFPEGTIHDEGGVQTHHISYNGKVWEGMNWKAGMMPIYNPWA